MNRRLRIAILLSFALNVLLVAAARYHASYDAYTHMFFADHYLRHWPALWEPRWYAGFTVVSYPPLVHQVMALFALVLGVDAAFGILLLIVLVALVPALYAFARVFIDPDAAGYAALATAVLPSLYLSAYTFGQLPTLMAALFALLAFAALARFLRTGERLSGALAVALVAASAAAHHATLLLLPLGGMAITAHLLINRQVTRRHLLTRLTVAVPLSATASLFVIWPFWLWGSSQIMQTPIDHLSRHNFLADGTAWLMFFLPVYGLFALLVPYALWNLSRRALAALAALFALLFTLGLGGTTSLPRVLFGPSWAWLTYDRFALWASLVLLVFFGQATALIRRRFAQSLPIATSRLLMHARGTRLWARAWVTRLAQRDLPCDVWRSLSAGTVAVLGGCACMAAAFPILRPTQPPSVYMRPIAAFLNEGDRSQWRYLTFGFGDQYALLSLLTGATTIDGSYHSARNLPELRESGIGQIDSAFWTDKGVGALDPILAKSGEHGVRWGFVYRDDYVPVLRRHGWQRVGWLSNGVQVWEDPRAIRPMSQDPPADDRLQAVSWSVLPLASLALAGILALGYRWRKATARSLLGLHTLATGLLPLSLGFWYYDRLAVLSYARVYFTYTDTLLFMSDAVIIVAVTAWGLARLIDAGLDRTREAIAPAVLWLTRVLFALCALSSLSMLWAGDPRVSLHVSLHLWLLFGFYCSLKDHPVSWRVVALGAAAALLVQVGIGGAEFALQSTAFLDALNMKWPGPLEPSIRGASVVQLADGTRWLRAYGSLPHPNILGGLASVLLAGPSAGFLLARRWLAAPVVVAGMALLCLTFSRSALLGCAAAAVVLVFHRRRFERWRLPGLAAASLLGLLIITLPLSRLLVTRVAGFEVPTEQQSIQVRAWMTQQSLLMVRAHPILGVGVGNYTIALSNQVPGDFMVEPVHNIPLLVASELGLPGVLLATALAIILLAGIRNINNPAAVVASAMLAGLATAALFDHYLWTLAPGRDLLWWVLGLWAGWSASIKK